MVCDDPQHVQVVRELFADALIDEPAPLAFALQRPKRDSKLFVVLDRSGFVLGRTRSIDDCVSILAEHVGAWLRPPAGTTRLRVRALQRTDGAGAVLAAVPLFTEPPAVERRLDGLGFGLLDRHVVDLDSEGRLWMTPSRWRTEAATPIQGHAQTAVDPVPVDRLLVPMHGHVDLSPAQVVAQLAAAVGPNVTGSSRLSSAEALVDRVTVVGVDLEDRGAPYRALVSDS